MFPRRLLVFSLIGIGLVTSCPMAGVSAAGPSDMGGTVVGTQMPDKACCLSATPTDSASDIPSRVAFSDAVSAVAVGSQARTWSDVPSVQVPREFRPHDPFDRQKFDCRSRMKRE